MKTSKLYTLLTITVLAVIIIVGCENAVAPTPRPDVIVQGSFALAVNRTTIPTEVKKIVATLERTGFATMSDSIVVTDPPSDSLLLSITNIPGGSWALTIRAYDIANNERYIGNATVAIQNGMITSVTVTMVPSSAGVGSLLITLIWPNPYDPNTAPKTYLAFDGADDFINLSTIATYGAQVFTYAMWVYPQDVVGPHILVHRGDAAGTLGVSFGINEGKIWVGGNGGGGWYNSYVSEISANAWTHVAAVYNETAQTVAVYKNGLLVHFATGRSFKVDPFPGSGTAFKTVMGRNHTLFMQHYAGLIDDFAIWNRELDTAAVLRVFNSGPGIDSADQIAYFKMNENSGMTISDPAHPSLFGSLGGGNATYAPDWLTMALGQIPPPLSTDFGLFFSGENDFLDITSLSRLDTTVFTVSVWLRPFEVSGVHSIFGRGSSDGMRGVTIGLEDGKIWVGGSDGSGWNNSFVGNVPKDSWTHVTAVYKQSLQTIDVYLNGNFVAQGTSRLFQADPTFGTYKTFVGRNFNASTQFFIGTMDDLIIWKGALSPSEINQVYQSGVGSLAAKRISHWKFDEGYGMTTADDVVTLRSGSLGNGTEVDAPWWSRISAGTTP